MNTILSQLVEAASFIEKTDFSQETLPDHLRPSRPAFKHIHSVSVIQDHVKPSTTVESVIRQKKKTTSLKERRLNAPPTIMHPFSILTAAISHIESVNFDSEILPEQLRPFPIKQGKKQKIAQLLTKKPILYHRFPKKVQAMVKKEFPHLPVVKEEEKRKQDWIVTRLTFSPETYTKLPSEVQALVNTEFPLHQF